MRTLSDIERFPVDTSRMEKPLRARRTAREHQAIRISLPSRLERLESRTADTSDHIKIRFGNLRRLPPDFKGEMHVVKANQLPDRNGQAWVEFEEASGRDPNPRLMRASGEPKRLDDMFV